MDAVWWRKEPLTEKEDALLGALLRAHHLSVFRPNASSVAVVNAADASQDMSKAIVAGIMTMGGLHAPLLETYQFLSLPDPAAEVPKILGQGQKVPGWGGTFQKEETDPIWKTVSKLLQESGHQVAEKIVAVTLAFETCGKLIYPNPSAYTAATAIIIGLAGPLVAYLFIQARLAGWAKIAADRLLET